jgi:hypothetical protein
MRDDFQERVKRVAAQRAGSRCSSPDCGALTCGPQDDPAASVNVGVAAHITAASSGGPRYNPALSPEDRKSPENAIWLCQSCAKRVDNDQKRFTESTLRGWKTTGEAKARSSVGKAVASTGYVGSEFPSEAVEILVAAADDGDIARFSSDQSGDWVRAGGRNFVDFADPAVAATYVEALEDLLRRRLVCREGETLYSLTGTGFKLARALKNPLADVTESKN